MQIFSHHKVMKVILNVLIDNIFRGIMPRNHLLNTNLDIKVHEILIVGDDQIEAIKILNI